jgi:hypothetical protein
MKRRIHSLNLQTLKQNEWLTACGRSLRRWSVWITLRPRRVTCRNCRRARRAA